MTLLAFVMMIFAAQIHGARMAGAAPDHGQGQMQVTGAQPSAHQQCTDQGGCHGNKDLCETICSGLANTILTDAQGIAPFSPASRLTRRPHGAALDGIIPALGQRPPITLHA